VQKPQWPRRRRTGTLSTRKSQKLCHMVIQCLPKFERFCYISTGPLQFNRKEHCSVPCIIWKLQKCNSDSLLFSQHRSIIGARQVCLRNFYEKLNGIVDFSTNAPSNHFTNECIHPITSSHNIFYLKNNHAVQNPSWLRS
jgi:hypothetical protein